MKQCSSCKETKNVEDFYKRPKSKDGYRSNCKACEEQSKLKWKETNKEHTANYNLQYYKKTKEIWKDYRIQYNKEHKEKKSDYNREYAKENREILNATKNIRGKQRRKEDIHFKLACSLRSRFYQALQKNYKSGSAVDDLGCSIENLKWWLEFWFDEGMSWNNYGNKAEQWSIDHIKPLSKFDLTDRNQLLEACNYKNLQPLWHIDNIKKGNK